MQTIEVHGAMAASPEGWVCAIEGQWAAHKADSMTGRRTMSGLKKPLLIASNLTSYFQA